MAHNSVQIVNFDGSHAKYTDWITARGLIETGLALELSRTPSGNRVKAVQMLTARHTEGRPWEKETWSKMQSGRYGPLVMQVIT